MTATCSATAAGCSAALPAWPSVRWSRPFYVAGVLLGAGYGLAFASVGNLVVNAVEPRHTGVATGVNTIVRTVGGAVGAQLAAAILVPPTESRCVTAFAIFAGVAVVALAAAFAIPSRRTAPAYAS